MVSQRIWLDRCRIMQFVHDLKCGGGRCVDIGLSLGKLDQGTKTNENFGKISGHYTTNIYYLKHAYQINSQRERKVYNCCFAILFKRRHPKRLDFSSNTILCSSASRSFLNSNDNLLLTIF